MDWLQKLGMIVKQDHKSFDLSGNLKIMHKVKAIRRLDWRWGDGPQ